MQTIIRDPEKLAAVATGRPVCSVEIKIVDKAGRELPQGESGQVLCRAPQTKGYWRKDKQTRRLIRNDWLHTGDVGFVDEAGYLHLRDRMNDPIISGGENIYPTEVESAVFGHPIVAEVVIIGIPDPVWGQAVKAVLVVKPGCEPDTKGILHYVRERLAPYKVPKSRDYVEILPHSAAGKTLRRAVRDSYAKRPASVDT